MIALVAVEAGAGTMAYFYGSEEKSGSAATGTLTLSKSAMSGFNVGNLDCGDEWTVQITLTNDGTLDAMYVYMGFEVTYIAALADQIILEEVQEWCHLKGWTTTTYVASLANVFLDFWDAPEDDSISLWDLEFMVRQVGQAI